MILSYAARYKIKNLEEKGKEFQEKLVILLLLIRKGLITRLM